MTLGVTRYMVYGSYNVLRVKYYKDYELGVLDVKNDIRCYKIYGLHKL
jgi:hypothetical protein